MFVLVEADFSHVTRLAKGSSYYKVFCIYLYVFFVDKCELKERNKVESLQWKLIKCLNFLCDTKYPDDKGRFAQYFDRLTELRTISDVDAQNSVLKKLSESWSKNYPLLMEIIS